LGASPGQRQRGLTAGAPTTQSGGPRGYAGKRICKRHIVTDINGQTSLLLVRGDERFLKTIDYPEHGPFIWELAAVVSRKKQLLPYLLQCLEKMSPA